MGRPLRFLVLSPTPTWPLDHGNRKRVHQVCSGLMSRGHEVHFLYYPSEHDWAERLPREALAEMERQWTSVRLVPASRPLHAPPVGQHHQLDEWWDHTIGDMLTWLFKVERYDALIVNYVWLSKAFDHCPPGVARILDTHDRFGGRKELLTSQGLEPEFFYLGENDEPLGQDRAQLVLAIKEQEAVLFASGRQRQGEVITLPYAETHQPASPRRVASDRLVFGLLGARNNLNRKGARALVDAVMTQGRPEALHLLIGGGLGDDFASDPAAGIEVMGRVEDIGEFYQACDALVVPLDSSTGQKVRVGEALARGVPLITHAHAFEGYPPADALHRLTSVDAIAKAMIDLAGAPGQLPALAEASRESQRQLLSRVDQGFAALIEGVLARRCNTVLALQAGALEHSMLARLRLTAALRIAARRGQVELWIDAPPDTTQTPATASWLRRLILDTGVGRLAVSGETLGECILRCDANLVWHASDLTVPEFSGNSLADPFLCETAPRDPGDCDPSLCLRSGGSTQDHRIYAPLLLGQGGLVDWRTAKGSLIWLVTPTWDGLAAQAAERLVGLPGCQLRIWCEDQSIAQPFRGFSGCLEADHMRLERPTQVVVFHGRGLRDRLMLELVAQSGAPCLSIDPCHASRTARGVHQVSSPAELAEWLDLLAFHRDLALRLPAVGRPMPVETFPEQTIFPPRAG